MSNFNPDDWLGMISAGFCGIMLVAFIIVKKRAKRESEREEAKKREAYLLTPQGKREIKEKAEREEKRKATKAKKKEAKEKRLDSMAASLAKVKREKAEREAKREAYLLTPEGKREKAEREAKKRLLKNLKAISGVNDRVAKTLMDKFKTRGSIKKASAEDLTSIPGVGMSLAEAIKRRIG